MRPRYIIRWARVTEILALTASAAGVIAVTAGLL